MRFVRCGGEGYGEGWAATGMLAKASDFCDSRSDGWVSFLAKKRDGTVVWFACSAHLQLQAGSFGVSKMSAPMSWLCKCSSNLRCVSAHPNKSIL